MVEEQQVGNVVGHWNDPSLGIPSVRAMHESNRAAWNEGAARYAEWVERDVALLRDGIVEYYLDREGGEFIDPDEARRKGRIAHGMQPRELVDLGDLRPWCRRAIHLQCASGFDTLALAVLGAGEVVGVDISDVHLENARRKSEALGFPARWVRCDILDTPAELDGTADLVYTGKGALNWIQDIGGWAGVVARLLRPGGRLYLYEGHPAIWPFRMEAATWEIEPGLSYFRTVPEAAQGWPESYIGNLGKPVEEEAMKWERLWPVSVVINVLIDAGLRLDRFTEHPEPYWDSHPRMPIEVRGLLPHTYALQMTRLGDA